jgi:hypothetical protein
VRKRLEESRRAAGTRRRSGPQRMPLHTRQASCQQKSPAQLLSRLQSRVGRIQGGPASSPAGCRPQHVTGSGGAAVAAAAAAAAGRRTTKMSHTALRKAYIAHVHFGAKMCG